MKVAALQMVSGVALQANLDQARRLLEQAAQAGAELAVLPEYFSAMGLRDEDKLALGETPGDGPVQRFLADAARALGLWIVGGTLPLATGSRERVHNSSLVFSPEGACVARYDKIHLFGFEHGSERFDEAATIAPGRTPAVFDLDATEPAGAPATVWRIGLSVCYDLRFPELYRTLGTVDLLLAPSAFTFTTGSAHWEVLLRARAIENQCYLLAPAQGGQHENGRRTWGHSMLVDPWGEIVAQRASGGEGVVVGELARARLREVRAILPALAHRVM